MNAQTYACIGGTNVAQDIKRMKQGQHIVSGTPGRVYGSLDSVNQLIYNSIFI